MEKDLFFKDWQEFIKDRLGRELWIAVYLYRSTEFESICFYCALIPNQIVNKVLQDVSWDLSIGSGFPGYIFYGGTQETKYFKFGNDDGIEPLIFHRDFHGLKESYMEISEEFRYYFNLYHDISNSRFIKFNADGDEEEVIICNHKEIKIKLNFLKEFLAVKNMHLSIFFDFHRFSSKSLQELEIEETSTIEKSDIYIYNHFVSDWNFPIDDRQKSHSRLLGKKLILPLNNYAPKVWPDRKNKKYVGFIIGVDENGNKITYTCDEDKLSNYFGKNPGAPHYLTPVFFKREVLSKYYSQPKKYSVEDGYIRCGGLWGLRIDNNHDKYVIVWLGDLGHLSIEHQMYWRHYNIPPEGKISKTTFKRAIMGQFADPERNDLIFKSHFQLFNKKWFDRFGWHMFIPLNKGDEHFYCSLRIPLTDDQSEFDQQVLALTKILIDSLNESEMEKFLNRNNLKGIGKLEEFLKSNGQSDYQSHTEFLRKLQALRSSGVGHRKGDKYAKKSKEFNIGTESLINVFDDILKRAILFLQYLGERFL